MKNRNIVVVGGSHGIGLNIAVRCVEQGAAVTVVSRTLGGLDAIAFPGPQHVQADVTADGISTGQLPERIDGLVYCPGSINLGPLRSVKPETMREDFELNVIAAMRCMQAALSGLKASNAASVVLFSTVAVQHGFAMHTSVAAAKGAVEALARTWAAELAPKIRVNCIAPALTETPLSEKLLSSEERRQSMAAMYPLGRFGQADDIAAAAQFLLSEDSSWVTGQVLGIDGGLSGIHK